MWVGVEPPFGVPDQHGLEEIEGPGPCGGGREVAVRLQGIGELQPDRADRVQGRAGVLKIIEIAAPCSACISFPDSRDTSGP